MDPLLHEADRAHLRHLEEAQRVLRLPADVSRFHWHPFGVFGVPLARRTSPEGTWSRRLHVWAPDTTPVGETSIYGVHTHSGMAHSHVLTGTLHHHLYEFAPDPDGNWLQTAQGQRQHAVLTAHVQGPTAAGVTHTLPANHPHGVTKPPGFAISLFEQLDEGRRRPFTTWQRLDAPAEELVTTPPVEPERVLRDARAWIEEALFAVHARA